jgi:hypothetical protein
MAAQRTRLIQLNGMGFMPLGGQFRSVMDFQGLENQFHMFLNGPYGNTEFIGDLLIVQPVRFCTQMDHRRRSQLWRQLER